MTEQPKPWLLNLTPPAAAPPAAPPATPTLPDDTLGVALSGGGIRSATFALGVLQALTRGGWLPRVDFLSTVSGGGYTGAFLGRFFDQCRTPDGLTGSVPDTGPGVAQARVARDLSDPRSPPVTWLRRHSNYLSPTGRGEAAENFAGFLRNLLSVYVVLGVFLFAVMGAFNALRYHDFTGPWAVAVGELVATLTPVTATLAPGAGPLAATAELTAWLAVLPLMLAYWLVSQDLPGAFVWTVLVAAATAAGVVLVGWERPFGLVVLAAAVGWSIGVWVAVERAEGHNDLLNPSRLALARNHLTRLLAFWLVVALGLAAAAVVDGFGRWLAGRMMRDGTSAANVGGWLTAAAAMVVGVASALRMGIRVLVGEAPLGSTVLGFARPALVAALVVLLGVLPPLVAIAFASHAAYGVGNGYARGLLITLVAVFVSWLFGRRASVPFINRSGPLVVYANRLARTFLGAVNPARRDHPSGGDVSHVVPGDDVPLAEYAPHLAGGPLHLINCAVNETVDVASQRGIRDRQAEPLAVGPAGLSIDREWHARWLPGPGGPRVAPLADPAESRPHPFLSRAGSPVAVEGLALREWVGISGAAVSPGMGRQTGFARSLLLTLANLRLGYWWDSGLGVRERFRVPVRGGAWAWVAKQFVLVFRSQALLLAELAGRFAGPWEREWYLSDGGNVENLGAYELIRRRVPFAVVCDAGEDIPRQGEALARLIRLVRVDFGAEVTEPAALPAGVPAAVAPHLGSVADLLTAPGQPSRAHAALLQVRYPDPPPGSGHDAWSNRRHTWLLYVKATVTGDEPADVRNYAAAHPDFPNETTLDQVFDEPQWESYRALGDHAGSSLFV
ncbi:MAG TPA: patatin-like phospholipase family protein [Urbifossiella sp.]|nr:patatin-like phospholipase family protein [Urbifossiella sp.]